MLTQSPVTRRAIFPRPTTLLLFALALLAQSPLTPSARAQSPTESSSTAQPQSPSLPDAPTPASAKPSLLSTPISWGAYNDIYRSGLTCGSGATISSARTLPTAQCGAILNLAFIQLETGLMGPQANRSNLSAYLSTDAVIPIGKLATRQGLPVLMAGYTRMFETGHAVNYGIAWSHTVPREKGFDKSIQFELRDYLAFANPAQHNVVFRVSWLFGLPD